MSRFRPRSPPLPGAVPSRGVPRGIEAPIRSTSICAKRSIKASNCEERLAIALNYSVTGLQIKWYGTRRSESMVVLVCGGRAFNDRELLFGVRDDLHRKMHLSEIIHGGAAVADALAGHWAREQGIYARVFKADWEKYGNNAGPIRNARMLENGRPALVVAFPGDR